MIPYCILAIEDDSDHEFMTALYYQYRKLMYSTTQKILKDQWSTDDVVQTSLEKLIDKIPLLRTLDQNHLANYIISTCKNNAYNLCRHNKRHEEFLFEESYDMREEPYYGDLYEETFLTYERIASLIEIWPELDQRSRYLLEARYILEKSHVEIAEDLGLKTASVRMALTRARKKAYSLIVEQTKKE